MGLWWRGCSVVEGFWTSGGGGDMRVGEDGVQMGKKGSGVPVCLVLPPNLRLVHQMAFTFVPKTRLCLDETATSFRQPSSVWPLPNSISAWVTPSSLEPTVVEEEDHRTLTAFSNPRFTPCNTYTPKPRSKGEKAESVLLVG
ncbi:hypothetical protein RJT34_14111 [Clitoria ternatea]|uniref:Uncharacterized protein n=1 Tax=Clitoria ternatea TaxID=43366 RepID=A0AAN9JRZ8_CLITE